MINTSPLSGMMELSPAAQIEFDRLKGIIHHTYESFGYASIDTPVLERSEVLLAKAGGETEKQIYRFQKGDADLSLRFDLTVPLARYVVEHRNELVFPFRRSAIGKVYRGERAQKGRFREFYQCDVDVIGINELPLFYDAEVLTIIAKVFSEFNLGAFTLRINNRKLLKNFFDWLEVMDSVEVLRVLDKADKIGESEVKKELQSLRLNGLEINKILGFSKVKGTLTDVKEQLEKIDIALTNVCQDSLAELEKINNLLLAAGVNQNNFCFDLAIARGLDYYTGMVFETNLDEYPSLGSVCSGGRYDNLTGSFSKQKMPGVGASIGLTRLFSQLLELGIVQETAKKTPSDLLVLPVTEDLATVLAIANECRQAGLRVETDGNGKNLKKQLQYANSSQCPFALILGDDELASKKWTLKNMATGEQKIVATAAQIKKEIEKADQ
jgi:histidyl-tRNA synthetase